MGEAADLGSQGIEHCFSIITRLGLGDLRHASDEGLPWPLDAERRTASPSVLTAKFISSASDSKAATTGSTFGAGSSWVRFQFALLLRISCTLSLIHAARCQYRNDQLPELAQQLV
jgi:hypothetical protein